MATVYTISCPVCENDKFSPYLSCKDYLASKEKFTIMTCDKCGFAFTQDFPRENEIGRYYDAPEYISHSDTQKGIVNSLYHLARKITLRSKARLIIKNSRKKDGELLDIGAGTGYFLNKMRDKGWNVTGVEKSEQARLYAKNRFGIDCYPSDYLFKLPEKSEDVITMWHVLEHVEKLNETFAAIYKTLRKDGIAVIALPNKESYDADNYREYWAAYDVPRHLWHFSPSDFTRLAEKHGFSVKKMKPMYFDAFYISLLSEKNRGASLATVKGFLNGGVFFFWSLTKTSKCSSIIYILRKK